MKISTLRLILRAYLVYCAIIALRIVDVERPHIQTWLNAHVRAAELRGSLH